MESGQKKRQQMQYMMLKKILDIVVHFIITMCRNVHGRHATIKHFAFDKILGFEKWI